jgi:cation diffusion facilitator family transporter
VLLWRWIASGKKSWRISASAFIIDRLADERKSGQREQSHSTRKLKSTFIGLIASGVLSIVKALGGIYGNSYALIADAIESTSDVLTSLILWFGLRWASKPPDKNHPYGHGKGEAFLSFAVGAAMVGAGALIAYQSVLNILRPHKSPAPFTLIILVAVIVVKELLYRFVLKTSNETKSHAVKADAFHHRSDAITSLAAFVGIAIGIIGGPGYEVADDWAALAAVGIILYNAYKVARPALGELLDETLEPEINDRIAKIAEGVEGVRKVEKCLARKMGPGYHVEMHLWIDPNISVKEGHDISHRAKDEIKREMPEVLDVLVHIEPDSLAV